VIAGSRRGVLSVEIYSAPSTSVRHAAVLGALEGHALHLHLDVAVVQSRAAYQPCPSVAAVHLARRRVVRHNRRRLASACGPQALEASEAEAWCEPRRRRDAFAAREREQHSGGAGGAALAADECHGRGLGESVLPTTRGGAAHVQQQEDEQLHPAQLRPNPSVLLRGGRQAVGEALTEKVEVLCHEAVDGQQRRVMRRHVDRHVREGANLPGGWPGGQRHQAAAEPHRRKPRDKHVGVPVAEQTPLLDVVDAVTWEEAEHVQLEGAHRVLVHRRTAETRLVRLVRRRCRRAAVLPGVDDPGVLGMGSDEQVGHDQTARAEAAAVEVSKLRARGLAGLTCSGQKRSLGAAAPHGVSE